MCITAVGAGRYHCSNSSRIIAGTTMIFKQLIDSICSRTATASPPASAQTYSGKLIKIIVPFPPHGTLDIPARLIAQKIPI
jgi:hypothetical protein